MKPPVSASKITVLLADDHAVVRQGFRALLQTQPDIVVVGEAETGQQAVQLTKKLRPQVVVMDIGMPQLNGIEATRQIVQHVPAVNVLILSCYGDAEYVQGSAEAGAAGYLLKQTAVEDLLRAIRETTRGNSFFSPIISKRLMENYRRTLKSLRTTQPGELLTSREAELLQLIAQGKANKQMAADLGISIKTVEKHRQRLMNKLNIHDIAGLTRYAMSKDILRVQGMLKAKAA